MPNISEKEYVRMRREFNYKGLPARWYRLDEFFDIKEGDIIIDGGMYHGDMSVYFSKRVGESGRVYSFEPNFINCITAFGKILNFECNNVAILPIALYIEKSLANFHIDKNYDNTGSIILNFRKIYNNENVFKTTTIADSLDNIVKLYRIPKVDFIWLNIEGAETPSLRGMESTLRNNNCKIAISTHKYIVDGIEKNTDNDVIDILEEYGYKTKQKYGYVYGYK